MNRQRKQMRILGKILFVLYVGFLIYFLIFSDVYGRVETLQEYHYNFHLFHEIRRFWNYRAQLGWFAVFTNLAGNILVFLPFGIFLPMASKYRSFGDTCFYSFAVSFCVETFQLLTRVGSFDVDDILLNTIGGVLGYIIFVVNEEIRIKNGNKKFKNTNRDNQKGKRKENA